MMQGLLLQLARGGFLLLLVLFVFFALKTMRADLYVASGVRTVRAKANKAMPRTSRAAQQVAQHLVVTGGNLAGAAMTLGTRPILIGRAQDATVVLDDDYASNHHARLSPQDGQWLLEDLGSTNGTLLDNEPVSTPLVVPIGTPIRIGTTTIELRA